VGLETENCREGRTERLRAVATREAVPLLIVFRGSAPEISARGKCARRCSLFLRMVNAGAGTGTQSRAFENPVAPALEK
jgi:hypothetical protein